jgi:hypothetical protein
MFRFKVVPDDRPAFEVEGKARDVVRWEALPAGPRVRRHLGQLESEPSMTALTELAWCAATRQNLYDGALKHFMATCDVTGVPAEQDDDGEAEQGEVDGLDPSRAGRWPGES